MHQELIDIFPLTLYSFKETNENYHNIQLEIQNAVEDLNKKNLWGRPKDWISSTHKLSNNGSFDHSILIEYSMNTVTKTIVDHAKNYLSLVNPRGNLKDLNVVDSWLTLTEPGQHAMAHDHGDHDISVVYWFKTNGADGDIYFDNPLLAIRCSSLFGNNYRDRRFSPEQGRFVLFPAWLQHGVLENKTNDVRISLSANLIIKK